MSYVLCVLVSIEARSITALDAGVTDSCGPPEVGAEKSNFGPLQEQ